ncbi:hypothetical protein D9M70_383350 [compost metagenome]
MLPIMILRSLGVRWGLSAFSSVIFKYGLRRHPYDRLMIVGGGCAGKIADGDAFLSVLIKGPYGPIESRPNGSHQRNYSPDRT